MPVTLLTFDNLQPSTNYTLEVRGQPMATSHPEKWSPVLKIRAATGPVSSVSSLVVVAAIIAASVLVIIGLFFAWRFSR